MDASVEQRTDRLTAREDLLAGALAGAERAGHRAGDAIERLDRSSVVTVPFGAAGGGAHCPRGGMACVLQGQRAGVGHGSAVRLGAVCHILSAATTGQQLARRRRRLGAAIHGRGGDGRLWHCVGYGGDAVHVSAGLVAHPVGHAGRAAHVPRSGACGSHDRATRRRARLLSRVESDAGRDRAVCGAAAVDLREVAARISHPRAATTTTTRRRTGGRTGHAAAGGESDHRCGDRHRVQVADPAAGQRQEAHASAGTAATAAPLP
eukprot:ctg_1031.g339